MRHLTIENYKQFSEVEEGDRVVFEFDSNTYIYTVEPGYLGIEDGDANSKILDVLGIDNHCKFCSEAYGYEAEDVGRLGFPECEYEDYDALFKVICAIFERIKTLSKGSNVKIKMTTIGQFHIKL